MQERKPATKPVPVSRVRAGAQSVKAPMNFRRCFVMMRSISLRMRFAEANDIFQSVARTAWRSDENGQCEKPTPS